MSMMAKTTPGCSWVKLTIALLGNIIDTLATLYHCSYVADFTELNPCMRYLLQWPWVFAATKILAVSGIVLWLWRERDSKYARIALSAAAWLYGVIGLYYCILTIPTLLGLF